ncbi:MAG: DNA-binding NarL/FixJ family response regulator, partial [Paraglaciecola sp.]
MLTILLADDHPMYRDALRGALMLHLDDLNLLETSDLNETVKTLHENDVDLLLFDLHMPGSTDLFGLIHIRKLFPEIPVAVVSGIENVGIVSKVMNTGALGFIPKTTQASEVAKAVASI